ncbi:MAG: TetR/AcrR family transcriptional regulator [Vicinamibacteria bacterium]|jgi:AcrR family transcriptional regulator|nr:TetR/AcrR family transcriptional regulator [Vicinamibacteria bacterium]
MSQPDRRGRRREKTRRALLDAALELIASRGLESTRVEDVTEAADLGKGAFYNYFDSKEALVATLLADAVRDLDEGFLGAAITGSQNARLRAVVRQHEAYFAARPAALTLFHQVRGLLLRGSAQDRLRPVVRDYLARVATCLEPAEPPSDDGLDRAAAVIGAVTGYHSFRIASGLAERKGTVLWLLGPAPDESAD